MPVLGLLVATVPAAAFGTNCYVVATGPGEQCVLIDPGIGVIDQLEEVLAEHRLRPAAVLLTHGHLDHVWTLPLFLANRFGPGAGTLGILSLIHI